MKISVCGALMADINIIFGVHAATPMRICIFWFLTIPAGSNSMTALNVEIK